MTLDVPGAASGTTEAFSINDRGEVVGVYGDSAGFHGFRFSEAGFTKIDVPGNDYTIAYSINNVGRIVGAASAGGFSYIDGRFEMISVPGSSWSYVSGNNDVTEMIGTYYDAAGAAHGFLKRGGTFTTIDVPVYNSNAIGSMNGLNNRGDIVGTYYDAEGIPHGFRYSEGAFSTIPVGEVANAYGINDRGQISGTYGDESGAHGFVYDHGILITINFPGVPSPYCPGCPISTAVFGINNRGQIVGCYSDRTGTHSFIATPRGNRQ